MSKKTEKSITQILAPWFVLVLVFHIAFMFAYGFLGEMLMFAILFQNVMLVMIFFTLLVTLEKRGVVVKRRGRA